MNQLQEIEIEVCRASGIKRKELFANRRVREYAYSRHICMYLALKMRLKQSLNHIGGRYGGRDHKAVIRGINIIKDHIKNKEPKLYEIVNKLPDRIKIHFEINPRTEIMRTLSLPVIKFPSLKVRA